MTRLLIPIFSFFLLIQSETKAQDPFFIHFYNNKVYYNPALTGIKGALSFDVKYKQQWQGKNIVPFQTAAVSVEESVPCAWFDFGVHYFGDQEGEGFLQTHQIGGSFAGTVALKYDGREGGTNLRIGGSFLWSQRRIDFSRLTFSDQLDSKYGLFDRFGNPNSSSFVPPDNDGISPTYFTPAIGIVLRSAVGTRFDNAIRPYVNSYMFGLSYHNLLGLSENEGFGHISSLLDLRSKTPERLTAFAEMEFALPISKHGQYISATPLAVFQLQETLNYFEVGAKLSYTNTFAVGGYFHFNGQSNQGNNTSWFNLLVEFGKLIEGKDNFHRIDIGLAYASNFSGLQNIVGPIFEVSISYQIGRSNVCRWMGLEDQVPYKKGPRCPASSRGKIYENIW